MTGKENAEPATDAAGAAQSLDDEAASARAKPLRRTLPVLPEALALVPARMLNEVMYCERLMYLEWVQGEWADNVFTVDGQAVHRRVNEEGTPLREPKDLEADPEEAQTEDRPYVARSVWLSSDRLGITAKIDLVEVDGKEVVPVEYKRSGRPDTPGGAYLPELVQVCAQVLVLRENGYRCNHGEIYYAKDRQRVTLDITDWLVQQTLSAVARVRGLAKEGVLPPPLDDSPKCHGCSLVGICLPDETRALAKEPPPEPLELEDDPSFEVGDDPWGLAVGVQRPVRRLFPARDDKLPVYVQTQGAMLKLSGERLLIQSKDEPVRPARLSNISHVALFGNVHVTTPTIRRLLDRGIPLFFFSYGGWFVGQAVGHDSKNVELRVAQYRANQDREQCAKLARGFVASKILNCRTLLRRNHAAASPTALSELKQLARKARAASSIESLLGIEGTAARRYFGEFTGMLKGNDEAFELDGRNRRPPRDPINALLSFCYSLLSKEFSLAIRAAGLDVMLGFYHQPHFGRPSLALDLMEEFRPVIADSVVIGAINNGVVQKNDFVRAAGAVALTQPARKRLILSFERRMDQLVTHPVFDYRISYRRVLEVQARLLSRVLLGEVPVYPEFRIR
jgi:CRISPR-associated protein Cas1